MSSLVLHLEEQYERVEPSFLTKRMPEPSLTSLPQNAHRFGTYISGYRTPFFRGLCESGYKGDDGSGAKFGTRLWQRLLGRHAPREDCRVSPELVPELVEHVKLHGADPGLTRAFRKRCESNGSPGLSVSQVSEQVVDGFGDVLSFGVVQRWVRKGGLGSS